MHFDGFSYVMFIMVCIALPFAGLLFIRENLSKLADEKKEHMTIGFEVAFPSLVEFAETLKIDIPKDLPIMQEIYAQRDLKLSR